MLESWDYCDVRKRAGEPVSFPGCLGWIKQGFSPKAGGVRGRSLAERPGERPFWEQMCKVRHVRPPYACGRANV